MEYEKLALVVHVLKTTQNLVISRCCSTGRQRNVHRFITHVHSNCYSLNLLFGDVLVAVVVVVCLSSLVSNYQLLM